MTTEWLQVLRALVAATAIITGCGRKMELYDWLPTESAPRGYPMRIMRGTLSRTDSASVLLSDRRTFAHGWGMVGSTMVVGATRKPLPAELQLTWFSYTEDKFYSGHFKLDTTYLQSLFAAGVVTTSDRRPGPYRRIIVGMAPGGDVSVWVAGGGAVTEVGHYRAEETQRDDFDRLEIPRAEYVREVLVDYLSPEQLEHLRAHGVPVGRWATYRKRVRWAPVIVGSTRVREIWLTMRNGEREFVATSGVEDPPDGERALPVNVLVGWDDSQGRTFSADLDLDEQDVAAAFAKLAPVSKPGTLRLQVNLDNAVGTATVALRNDNVILPLKTTPVEP